jgi:signal transduction histidine kinase
VFSQSTKPPANDNSAEMLESVRQIARRLRPSVLDQLGLADALQLETREFERRTGIRCKFSTSSEMPALDPDQITGTFRIFQEILTNVARHAQASRVSVSLTAANARVTLEVTDNGRGICAEDLLSARSLGLLGMRERAALMRGQLDLRRGRKGGTTVTLTVPDGGSPS